MLSQVMDCPERQPQFTREEPAGGKIRFVIIDDDPVFCQVLEHVALRSGMIAHSYHSYDEVEVSVLLAADVLILDYNLGVGETGLRLSRKLHENRVPAPILIVSASQEAFQETVWPDNIRGFTSKALGPFGVLDSILQVVESSRAGAGPREAMN